MIPFSNGINKGNQRNVDGPACVSSTYCNVVRAVRVRVEGLEEGS